MSHRDQIVVLVVSRCATDEVAVAVGVAVVLVLEAIPCLMCMINFHWAANDAIGSVWSLWLATHQVSLSAAAHRSCRLGARANVRSNARPT